MKDILLDASGDLTFNDSGDIQFTDSVSQAIAIRLKWFQNEWRLGPELGIPYYEEAFIKNPSTVLLEERMRTAISEVKEVEEIEELTLSLNRTTRKLNVYFKVKTAINYAEGRLSIDV